MQIYDVVNEVWIEDPGTCESLMKIMLEGRQVDCFFKYAKEDPDGYIEWDTEHWVAISENHFVRHYTRKGKVLKEYTGHSPYDLRADFHPEEAYKIEIS